MKDIFISYSKEDKSIAKKLVSKLEAEGYSCWIQPRDSNLQGTEGMEEIKTAISNSKVFIFMLSKYYENSNENYLEIETAVDNNTHIIPFKVGVTSDSLILKHFLHTTEWVDSYGDGFIDAYDILLEIISEVFDGKIPEKISKKLETKQAIIKPKNLNPNILTIVFAVLTVIFAFLYFTADKQSTEISNDNTAVNVNNNLSINNDAISDSESFLVGKWKIVDYSDSQTLTEADKQASFQAIENLKKNAMLVFNSDRSFSRIGFSPQAQTGTWEFNAVKKEIYLKATGSENVEPVRLLEYSDKSFVILVVEKVTDANGNAQQVTTKISLEKI